ncbi:hypothetical protein RF11_01586 [Thelohanellus kitauei]|uniref:Uncharacterized protein n=1 Tax=Thelohanellus kitauei TaxID=669202 RepID=A0A0C2JIY5_THEKT|nr:hypothetical protein RF11_01586 [Thelohanellus kitauei]
MIFRFTLIFQNLIKRANVIIKQRTTDDDVIQDLDTIGKVRNKVSIYHWKIAGAEETPKGSRLYLYNPNEVLMTTTYDGESPHTRFNLFNDSLLNKSIQLLLHLMVESVWNAVNEESPGNLTRAKAGFVKQP